MDIAHADRIGEAARFDRQESLLYFAPEIRPPDAPAFIVAQLLGAMAATFTFRWLVPTLPVVADRVVDSPGTPTGCDIQEEVS